MVPYKELTKNESVIKKNHEYFEAKKTNAGEKPVLVFYRSNISCTFTPILFVLVYSQGSILFKMGFITF